MMNDIPPTGRLAGIDYGTVRVGIAVCDPDRILASPYETYVRRNEQLDADYFSNLAKQERLVGWIVGLPIHLSGDESEKSREAKAFARWLHDLSKLPVAHFDERFSSSFAHASLGDSGMSRKKKKQRIDQIAAQIILSGYLESPGQAANGSAQPPGSAMGLDDSPPTPDSNG